MDIFNEIEKQIYEARKSGLYSVASLDMFHILEKLVITNKLYEHIDYTNDLLMEYLEEVKELNQIESALSQFLRALRIGDVVDNQRLASENSFLIGLYTQLTRETAMGKLIKYAKSGIQIDGKDIFELHNTLLCGTSSWEVSSIRTDNSKFIGKFVDGKRIIDYFPIDYVDVKEAADKISSLYNDRLCDDRFNNVFLQPFIIHGLLSGLQIFNDGNTRMGRIMQHALMWQLINERTNFYFDYPVIYATRSYYPVRIQYRNDIAKLVVDGDNDAWNNWFSFNLDRIEDSIYLGRENVKTLKRKMDY